MSSTYPIWHPYTQMHTAGMPLKIVRGEREFLYDDNGREYIDAISSWWVNLHGHAHPHIARAIAEQANRLEQVIFAGFTHQPAIDLAGRLLKFVPFHAKVFYSDNGSTAVEVAIKMALQYHKNKGKQHHKIVCFKDSYHGDTFGSMSVSARGVFTQPYHELLFEVCFIDTPNETNTAQVVQQLQQCIQQNDVAAFIFEPLVLGSAGMLMYGADVLNELLSICQNNGVLSIADEVFTGFGRTGRFLATDYCTNKPDIICLSKGITGGFLPFGATTCTASIYNTFLSDEKTKMLFHGHSYAGNPLGCAAGIASLQLFEIENTFDKISRIAEIQQQFFKQISNNPKVKQARQLGTILAVEVNGKQPTGYLNTISDQMKPYALERGILLRPLGNVIYILPPYCISPESLRKVHSCILSFLEEL